MQFIAPAEQAKVALYRQQVEKIGTVANHYAGASAFDDYTSRRSDNTLVAHKQDLAAFVDYLSILGLEGVTADSLQSEPRFWHGMQWGIVKGFVQWMLKEGYAIGTVNRRLSTVKTYAKLAAQAITIDKKPVIDEQQLALIRMVSGYGRKEGKKVNEKRPQSRVSKKKADAILLTSEQAEQLRNADHPRDAALMCLLLDHGLRASEAAELETSAVNLKEGTLTFYRPKVDNDGTHKLTAATLRALSAYMAMIPEGRLLWSIRKGGALVSPGLNEIRISERVRYLGKQIGVDGLSAHDCRHYCATDMARKGYSINELMQWFGWSSPSMAVRYIEDVEVAERDKG